MSQLRAMIKLWTLLVLAPLFGQVAWKKTTHIIFCTHVQLVSSGNYQWKKTQTRKYEEPVICVKFSMLLNVPCLWNSRSGHRVRWCFSTFITAISDKNERDGCVYLLHPVTNIHTLWNLCIDHSPVLLLCWSSVFFLCRVFFFFK